MKRVGQPLRNAIQPDKQGAKRHYGSHPYFTKRAWNVVQAYIDHFTSPGDTILDPFGGSGVTAVESLVLRRKAIYVDVSEWACFLARQTAIAPIDLSSLQDAFRHIEGKFRPFVEDLESSSNDQLKERSLADWFPKDVPLPSNADVRTVEELFTPRMLHALARLRSLIMETQDEVTRDLMLLAFSSTVARINKTFLSAANRAESRGGSAIFSIYRYKVAKKPIELPMWDQFSKRFHRLLEAKKETNHLIDDFYADGDTARFHHGSCCHLLDLMEPESVDYIYTDPPYGAHIAYLDLSTMWAAWLGMEPSKEDRSEEVIEGGELRKSRDDYQRLLHSSLNQMYEVLKSGAWLSIVFAHRDTGYWNMLVDSCGAAGFQYKNTVVQPVGVVWSMHKKKNPLRVLSGELVLNFQKPRPLARSRTPRNPIDLVRICSEKTIIERIGATTEDLHHALIPALLEAKLLDEFSKSCGDITPLLKRLFEFQDGRWHLKDGQPLSASIPEKDLARYYVTRFLQKCEQDGYEPTETEVHEYLLSAHPDGKLFPIERRTVQTVLQRVGHSEDGQHWRLGRHKERQLVLSV
jgi:16S rRNA G966 N2-methylase RsmD